jgi:UDP-GlcNAc:undecaprenyl-phosphate GlcNAc-1-phosphate transferase
MLVDGRPDPIHGLFAFLVAVTIAWLLVPLTEKAARRLNAIDEPRERSLHDAPKPKLGGLAILGGVLVAGPRSCSSIPG